MPRGVLGTYFWFSLLRPLGWCPPWKACLLPSSCKENAVDDAAFEEEAGDKPEEDKEEGGPAETTKVE